MIRRTAIGAAGAAVVALAVTDAVGQSPRLDTLAIRAHTRVLAHDSLLGRGAGSPGERAAADYIAAQCGQLGLEPLGGAYLARVPLTEVRLLPETRVRVRGNGAEWRFQFPDHVIPEIGIRNTLDGFAGRAVWLGEGGALTTGALETLTLAGSVAVVLGPADAGTLDAIAARGAVGLLSVAADDETFELYRRSRGGRRLYHADAVASSLSAPIPSAVVDVTVARSLLAAHRARRELPAPGTALEASVDVVIAAEERPAASWNVGCVLPGRDSVSARDAIAFTAHLDHLGVGPADATGDSIYNGFSDNAAGVGMLLAIAKAAISNRPRASWLFLFFGAEEQGLLGSDYYVHAPPWPLERTRAVINLDAGAPAAPPVRWRLAGVDSTGLGAVAATVAARQGWEFVTSPPKPNSDYYPFVRHGVPAVFIVPGPGAYEGLSEDESNALRRRWDRYHQAGDEWHPEFPLSGLERYAAFAYLLGRALDEAPLTEGR